MLTFLLSVVALVLGYLLYGGLVEKIFSPDLSRLTPAVTKADGLDFVQMPSWKVFMIQFLNIAGTGPIFGAIMGAKFGASAYLWIVFGCIFAGATHDYLAGMLSVRSGGEGLPRIIGHFLGTRARRVMVVFTIILLLLVGAVFTYSPAIVLDLLFGKGSNTMMIWVVIIFIYYIIATLLPVDKVIGKIYPVFAIALIFMAISLMVCLLVKWPSLPEIWDGLDNRGPSLGMNGQPIFPCLFITIACGAISGFHATQSPLMARCVKNEKICRPIFYGSMITEGIVALIWATIASYFFYDGGAQELGLTTGAAAPSVVVAVAGDWLGVVGSILAVLGVVVAPITSGDTAFRSARLVLAEAFNFDQKPIRNRLMLCIPIFIVSGVLLWYNISDEAGFNVVWRYFGWANQALSIFTLWAITVYLARGRKGHRYLISMIPACFMGSVCLTYISVQKIGFNLPYSTIPYIAVGAFLVGVVWFYIWYIKDKRKCAKS